MGLPSVGVYGQSVHADSGCFFILEFESWLKLVSVHLLRDLNKKVVQEVVTLLDRLDNSGRCVLFVDWLVDFLTGQNVAVNMLNRPILSAVALSRERLCRLLEVVAVLLLKSRLLVH